jgi:hypothetical protein
LPVGRSSTLEYVSTTKSMGRLQEIRWNPDYKRPLLIAEGPAASESKVQIREPAEESRAAKCEVRPLSGLSVSR